MHLKYLTVSSIEDPRVWKCYAISFDLRQTWKSYRKAIFIVNLQEKITLYSSQWSSSLAKNYLWDSLLYISDWYLKIASSLSSMYPYAYYLHSLFVSALHWTHSWSMISSIDIYAFIFWENLVRRKPFFLLICCTFVTTLIFYFNYVSNKFSGQLQ